MPRGGKRTPKAPKQTYKKFCRGGYGEAHYFLTTNAHDRTCEMCRKRRADALENISAREYGQYNADRLGIRLTY